MIKDFLGQKRVLVGMSGGIDSTVTALLLKEKGFEVIGASLHFFDSETGNTEKNWCEVKKIAESLKIKHVIIDKRAEFKKNVISQFTKEYLSGITPSICTRCNPAMKFPSLLETASRLDCEYIATGHYVQVVKENGKYWLQKGVDSKKDQSYFLWKLPDGILSRWITPLGGKKKEETRRLAIHYGFTDLAKKKESMGVCFLRQKNYKDFLEEHASEKLKSIGHGDVCNEQGEKVGQHNGFPFYTIGQKKGLTLKSQDKSCIIAIDSRENRLIVGSENQLYTRNIVLTDYALKIPYTELVHPDVRVMVRGIGRNPTLPPKNAGIKDQFLHIELNDDAWAMASGQPVVFYKDDRIVGGGIAR